MTDVGTVVGGVLGQGRVNIRDDCYYHLGPNAKGEFIKVKVISIHRHRMSVHYVHCGQTATLALDGLNDLPDWKIHKGMVLLGTEKTPECYTEFEADLMVLYHATGVSAGMCGMVNSGSIRQHARVISVTVCPEDEMGENFDNLSIDKETLAKINKANEEDDPSEGVLTSGTQGKVTFRFMYEPCYLRLGAQILFMEGRSKCLGRVTRLIPRNNTQQA